MALIGNVWLSAPMLPALCALTDTHRTTAARWLSNRQLPRAVYLLLDLAWHGRIERIHATWAGWTIDAKSGALCTPAGVPFLPGEILAMPASLSAYCGTRGQPEGVT